MAESGLRALERAVGAVLVPEVRAPGTPRSVLAVVPPADYLRRFPPAGVVVFGRTFAGAVSPAPQLERVRAHCAEAGAAPPFACCDLEQGAGLHLPDATRLPPALALAAAAAGHPRGEAEGLEWIRAAGELTAAEARAHGIALVLAPVADVNTCRDNPIVSVRSFGDSPEAAGRRARAFVEGLHRGGAGACLKHFPGHGDTSQDSHLELPRIVRARSSLEASELVPFAAALAAGPETVMVAHLDVPALTGAPGTPATLAGPVMELLRDMGFGGAVLSDAMDMGALEREPRRFVRALLAGCDGLLCPADPLAAAEELLAATASGELPRERLEAAARRMHGLRERLEVAAPRERSGVAASASTFCEALSAACLVASPGAWPWPLGEPCELLAPVGECGAEARAALELLGRALGGGGDARAPALLPVVCEVGAWKGRYGLSASDLEALHARLEGLRAAGRPAAILWAASPQVLPAGLWNGEARALLAFAPTPPMLAAAGRWLLGRARAGGSLPARLG